jgi:hypothetical protein
MSAIDRINSSKNVSLFEQLSKKKTKPDSSKKDSAEISNTAKVLGNVDKFMNLGSGSRTDLSEMNGKEKEEFIQMTADLIKHGIVGYEVREVNGQPEKHDITLEIGDERLYGTKLYKKKYFEDQSKQ